MPRSSSAAELAQIAVIFARCHSTILKLLGDGTLVLVLLIPLAMDWYARDGG